MAGGTVNRTVLQSNYQNAGDTYQDTKTEGAFEVIAQQIDDNWNDYAALKQGFNRVIDGGTFTDAGTGNTYDGGTF